jgi:hypothetical protein
MRHQFIYEWDFDLLRFYPRSLNSHILKEIVNNKLCYKYYDLIVLHGCVPLIGVQYMYVFCLLCFYFSPTNHECIMYGRS